MRPVSSGNDVGGYMASFKSGKILMTSRIGNVVMQDLSAAKFVHASLQRHLAGDWGDVCQEDRAENEFALKSGLRLFSAYKSEGIKIWIITEADRSATTILFPDEY